MNENVNVCITPKGDKPVLHFSQFDNERVFTVTVLADDGESAVDLTDLDIEFRLRKTDSHVVTIAPISVVSNVITFLTTEQLCACCGQNIASVVIMNNDSVISTLDILVDIQRDILSGGLTSESDIRNLTTQIETIIPEVLADDYYTKTEVDDLIADIPTFDPTNYYDKSDVDTLLSAKADASAVYTKGETDTLLSAKADAADVYTKDETDTLLSAKQDKVIYATIENTSIATFNDAADGVNLTDMKVGIVAEQESGTPSPSTPLPISGYNHIVIDRCGKNLLNIDNFVQRSGYSNLSASLSGSDITVTGYTSGGRFACFYIRADIGKSYTVKFSASVNVNDCRVQQSDVTPIEWLSGGTSFFANKTLTFTAAKKWVMFWFELNADNATISELQVELGTATAYEPYNGTFFTYGFGSTYYGGYLDCNNQSIVVTHGYLNCNGTENWQVSGSGDSQIFYLTISNMKSGLNLDGITNYIKTFAGSTAELCIRFGYNSNIIFIYSGTTLPGVTDLASFKTYLSSNNLQVVYELASVETHTIGKLSLTSASGINNVFANSGDILKVTYFKPGCENIAKLIQAY